MVARQMLTQGIFTTFRFLWRIFWKGTALAVPQEVFGDTRATERMRGSARKRFSLLEPRALERELPEPRRDGMNVAPA